MLGTITVVTVVRTGAPPDQDTGETPRCYGKPATIVGTDSVGAATTGSRRVPTRGPRSRVYHDHLRGGRGDDLLDGGPGIISAGRGGDWVHYDESAAGVDADLRTRVVTGQGRDRLVSIEVVAGSRFADSVRGAASYGYTILPREGDDTIVGDAARETVYSGPGEDVVRGGGGRDTLNGEVGNDRLHGGRGGDVVYGDVGHDLVRGGEGDDLALDGDTGEDRVLGGPGDDEVFGDEGTDVLRGGAGRDVIGGGYGDDDGDGGAGSDRCRDVEQPTCCEH